VTNHQPELTLSLDAVIVAVTGTRPRILTVGEREHGLPALPAGPLGPEDTTLERALRRWIDEQAGIAVGYVDQLYTFGDLRRGLSQGTTTRALSVAYLALVREEQPAANAAWVDWYDLFPWEDHRTGPPAALESRVRPGLADWVGADVNRSDRVAAAFGTHGRWDGIRVLDRYELLYEAGLVAETDKTAGLGTTSGSGLPMAFDHRRIVATALGRLRGKLTYRPVVFELLPDTFTLLTLQRTVEALAGVQLHKQNFRRLVERTHLVEGTGKRAPSPAGRPAELFRFRTEVLLERPRPGLGMPYK
jgi:hypothetical protein